MKHYKTKKPKTKKHNSSWDDLANWYTSWVGKKGSHYHRTLAIPTVMELLELQHNEKVLDIGAGQGVLAPHILKANAHYTGVDLSPKMIQTAKRFHPKATFIIANATQLTTHKQLKNQRFHAAIFMLSLQDMQPLENILKTTSNLLEPNARLIIFMIHPCFRIPRQSGWGFDKMRKLNYRRIDSYLSPKSIPMKTHKNGSTRSFHRPLEHYVKALSNAGLSIDTLKEIADKPMQNKRQNDNPEIPLFLAIRAKKS